uniref:Uncharacterized protein n=1 Tax=Solanum tuberosum TaxID=4113 RepID=M1DUL6_SOLTU
MVYGKRSTNRMRVNDSEMALVQIVQDFCLFVGDPMVDQDGPLGRVLYSVSRLGYTFGRDTDDLESSDSNGM